MKVFYLAIVLLFFLSCGGVSSIISGSQGPFFWTAEKDGKTHHILGTLHYGINFEDLQCFETIKDRLKNSKVLFTEVNISTLNRDIETILEEEAGKVQEESLQESAFWKNLTEKDKEFLLKKYIELREFYNGQSLIFQDDLNIEDIKELVKRFRANEAIETLVNYCFLIQERSKLEEINLQLEEEIGRQDSARLDNQVFQFAGKHSIIKMPLETVKKQLESGRNRSRKVFQEFLSLYVNENKVQENALKFIKNYDGFCSNSINILEKVLQSQKEMLKAYKSGTLKSEISLDNDIQAMFSVLAVYNIPNSAKESFKKDYKNIYNQEILKERNEDWIPVIISAHNSYNNVFIAAGVSHFIGEYDVLNLLKKEGFTIKRFSSECVAE